MEVGEEGECIPIAYIVTTRMTCIKMGSDESHFNVSLIVRDKVTRPCPQTTTFLKRKESRSGIEPRSFRLPAYRLTARPNRLSLHSVFALTDTAFKRQGAFIRHENKSTMILPPGYPGLTKSLDAHQLLCSV